MTRQQDPRFATVATKGQPWHDVTAYGATGDGTTDDSGAIQSAVDAAESGSGVEVVYYPDPDTAYHIESPITVKSGVYHIGDGRSKITAGDLGANAMFQNTSGPTNVRFEGLFMDGSNGWTGTSYDTSQKHIYTQDGADLMVINNKFVDSPATSVGCDRVVRDYYLFNEIYDAGTDGETNGSNGIGIGVGDSQTETLDNQEFTPSWAIGNYVKNTTMHGVTFEGTSGWSQGCVAIGNWVLDAHTGIGFEKVRDGFSAFNRVRNTSANGFRFAYFPNATGPQAGPDRLTSVGDHSVNASAPSNGDFVMDSNATDVHLISPQYLHNISDNGTRTLINGWGTNAGDPRSTGDWNGNGQGGVMVRDTTNDKNYVYINGAWEQL